MKYFIVLALISCVAFVSSQEEYAYYNECETTVQGYDAWKLDGKRIVTFGISWCKKSWKTKFTVINGFKENGGNEGWEYHYLNCNKFAEGTCAGLFNNFLDYVDPEIKMNMRYRTPRTFCIKRQGDNVKVLPITRSGRLHSGERSSEFFQRWLDRCDAM